MIFSGPGGALRKKGLQSMVKKTENDTSEIGRLSHALVTSLEALRKVLATPADEGGQAAFSTSLSTLRGAFDAVHGHTLALVASGSGFDSSAVEALYSELSSQVATFPDVIESAMRELLMVTAWQRALTKAEGATHER